MSIWTSIRQLIKNPATRFPVPLLPGFSLPLPTLGLWYCGIWPLGRTWSTKIYIFFTGFAIIHTMMGETLYCKLLWGDIGAMCGTISTLIAGARVIFVCLHFMWRTDEVSDMLTIFRETIWISREVDEKVYLSAEKQTLFLNTVSFSILGSMFLKSILPYATTFNLPKEEKLFSFGVDFPYPYRDPGIYHIIYILSAHAGWACVLCIIAHDSLLNYILVYTCTQFRRLHEKIMNIGDENTDKDNMDKDNMDHSVNLDDKVVAAGLAEAVEEHNRLIEFVDMVESLFSPNILFQFMVTSFLICVLGIQFLLVPEAPVKMIETALFFITGLGQLYGICYSGQQLIECSNQVGDAAYNFKWIDANKKFHMNVIMIIQRSQNPLQLTAYKFFNLSMESFSSIISTAGSYFALIKQLMEE